MIHVAKKTKIIAGRPRKTRQIWTSVMMTTMKSLLKVLKLWAMPKRTLLNWAIITIKAIKMMIMIMLTLTCFSCNYRNKCNTCNARIRSYTVRWKRCKFILTIHNLMNLNQITVKCQPGKPHLTRKWNRKTAFSEEDLITVSQNKKIHSGQKCLRIYLEQHFSIIIILRCRRKHSLTLTNNHICPHRITEGWWLWLSNLLRSMSMKNCRTLPHKAS